MPPSANTTANVNAAPEVASANAAAVAGPTVSSAFLESSNKTASEPQTTTSQSIANAVLAGKRTGTADMSKLTAALGTGAGVPGNPIVVQLNERECCAMWTYGILSLVNMNSEGGLGT